MSDIVNSPERWSKPFLVAIGARDDGEAPATIDLADGQPVVDLSERSVPRARKPQAG